MNGKLPLNDSSLWPALGRAHVPLADIDSLYDNSRLLREHFQNLSAFASIVAADNDDRIVFFYTDMVLFIKS
jgi:hypothetical protein